MKNINLLIAFIGCVILGFSQEENPVKENFSFEFKYGASSGEMGEIVYSPELLFRWRLTTQSRIRVGVWFQQDKEVTQVSKNDFGGMNNGYITDNTTALYLKPAFEFTFKTTPKLQPYWALEFPIGYFVNKIHNVDVANGEYDFGVESSYVNPSLNFGLNAKLGINALVSKQVYLGAEMGLGAVYVWQLSEKWSTNRDRQTEKYGFFEYGMGMTTSVKVGCLF